ncbi:MAG: ribose 5-phosphate isomerase B [Bacteroidetes bacterium]|nr:MAG: ribose 5-phosphate isomerase B [Bacteroidota bacterium]
MQTIHSQFNLFQPIAIGCDHAGFDYKEEIVKLLRSEGFNVEDFGTTSKDSVDYPDFAHPVAEAIEKGQAAFGILLCGSGNGVAITANKHQNIRAAICWSVNVSKLARLHNDANIICIPARFVSLDLAQEMIWKFLQTEFEGGRHADRVHKIACA